ncbi:MAG: radical SAM protein [Planctomycetaceae bacterium]|nr:radical SAM protein [Planctomycetaceae bacterium]
MQEPFPVSLIFPPQGHFTQPYLALPCLKAWLIENGVPDTEIIDANIEAYEHFLSAPYLARAQNLVHERLPLARWSEAEAIPFEDLGAWRAAAESAASAEALIERVDGAKAVLRGEAFYDETRYIPAVRTLYGALRLVSAAHYPAELTPHNFTTGYGNDRAKDVLAATTDALRNPFVEFFAERILPRLLIRKPRVVGLSVIYGSQLVPALTLGRLVKQHLPECHVTMGGGFLSYIGPKLMAAPGVDVCFDSIVMYEGEAPLLALCNALREGLHLGEVGSLLWFDRSAGSATAVTNSPGHPIRLEDAPLPNFDDLPLGLYFAPEVVLPYDVNRGCYYGACTFCTLPTVIGPGYRTRSAKRIVDHVLALKQRHGTNNVNFITDCMPPGMLNDLPAELIARDADIRWWADARVEPKAYDEEGAKRLYDSGCRKLLFGFETATPRLLKMMQKGQSPRATLEVARNCARAGISVTFYAMVGFPTETREEARGTLAFLAAAADEGTLREVSLQTFHIDEVAKTYHEPERFGIQILSDPTADLQLYHNYEASSGMTQAEAAEMFEELMAGLREHLPLFSGDNIFFFMQKSHYFLHLAKGTSPDEFAERAAERTRGRTAPTFARDMVPTEGVHVLELSHPYAEAVRTLAHPLAKAIRPDFTVGRFVPEAAAAARAALPALSPRRRLLAWNPETAEFADLSPDTQKLWTVLLEHGSAAPLADAIDAASGPARERLEAFARQLAQIGLLRQRSEAGDPAALQAVSAK